MSNKRRPSARKTRPARRARRASPSRRRKTARRKSSSLFPAIKKLIYWGAVAGLWVLLGFSGLLAWYAIDLPDPGKLKIPARAPSVTILDANGAEIAKRGAWRGSEVRIKELPPHLLHAIIATEDRHFYSHFGIDPLGLARASIANIRAGRIVQGGSTITQQLAKNLFLKPARTLKRKMRELLLAIWLERKFTKDEILAMYLNRVYLGAGSYGVDAAAQRYFNKKARHVTLSEAAMLAGLLKAPSRYAPTSNPALARKRMALVLKNMERENYIGAGARKRALAARFAPVPASKGKANGYALDWVAEMLPDYAGKTARDLIVETSLDARMQRQGAKAISALMAAEGKKGNVSQAAIIVLDASGAVKALIGGVDYAKSQYNRAIKARRQPGSAFKPFVYLAAIESGMRSNTVRVDRPMIIDGWMPRNYSGEYTGRVTLSNALARSINTVAVGLAHEIGAKRVRAAARRLGISSRLHDNPSIALGTAEVSLLELTGAYTPFMNGGYGNIPHVIERIRTTSGKVLYKRSGSGPGRVVAPRHVATMNTMLARVMTHGTGRNAALKRPAAGKTGTSQGFRDAWFIGYSAKLATGVWVGNDDGSPMKKVTGGGLPARIWKHFMTAALKSRPPRPLPGSGGNTFSSKIAATSGKSDMQPKSRFTLDANFLKRLFSGKN